VSIAESPAAHPSAIAVEEVQAASSPTPQPRGGRLNGVDGLRACAALWVVLFHIRAFSGARLGPLDLLVRSGSTGVSLFLVLSGFCLYLPVVKGGGRLRVGRFFRRRALRLLPAYYVSLVVVLLVVAFAARPLGLAPLSGSQLAVETVTHLTMTHSLFPSTFYTLNGAYWSLALEWQLYLSLPLLVFAVRRLGLARVVFAVVTVNVVYRLGLQVAIDNHMVAASSTLATEVLPNLLPGRWAEFAFGMVAAHVYVRGSVSRIASPFGWALLPLVPLAVLSVGSPLEHILFGGVFFLLLCIVLSGGNLIARILSWRPLVTLGVMSYSIYLVHQPIVVSLAHLLHQTGASPLLVFVEIVLLIPAILGVAWLLFITVEWRTLHSSRTTPEPGSPEAWLLAPLRLLRRSRPAAPSSAGDPA
jgi:peptidoglycan/LPS O-acetylase OafA/YrhL